MGAPVLQEKRRFGLCQSWDLTPLPASCPRGSGFSAPLPGCVHGFTRLLGSGHRICASQSKGLEELHQGAHDILEGPSPLHGHT